MSKIESITLINQQDMKHYEIGRRYNGLLLENIVDYTASGDNFHVPHFNGFTADKELVFEAINAPMEIAYCADT